MSTTAAPQPVREPSFFSQRRTLPRSLDLLVMSILLILGIIGFQDAYGGFDYLLAGLMALVLGLIIALIGARWRWGVIRLTVLTLLVFVVFGSTFATPTRALFGVIPTGGSLWELIKSPVTSWKSMLTIAAPVGSAQSVLGVVWISVLVLTVLGMTCVLRSRHYVLAWMFPFVLLAVSILFGTVEAVAPLLRGIPFAALSIAWLTWRFESARITSAESSIISDSVRPGSWKNPVLRRRVIGGSIIIAISCLGTVSAQALLDPPEGTIRYAARDDLVPPFDPDEYVSPLTELRGYIKNDRDTELFTLTNAESKDKIRLAAMDRYDNQVYNVASSTDPDSPSGAFLRTAAGVDLHEPTSRTKTTTITIGDYRDVWLPTLGGRTERIDAGEDSPSIAENLYLNPQSETAVDASQLTSGETYDLAYEPYSAPSQAQQRSLVFSGEEVPDLDEPSPKLKEIAETYISDAESDYDKVTNLQNSIRSSGFFSHGVDDGEAISYAGHGKRRLDAMLEEPEFDEEDVTFEPLGPIGDEEQFAALMAVMLQSLDIPSRVVFGFEVPEGESGTVTITGGDVTAWVEVHFEGYGWVRFDPTPDEDQTPTQPEENNVDKPRPQVAQPPPPPAEPPSPPPAATSDDSDGEDDQPEGTPSWVIYLSLGVIPFLVVGGFLAVVAIVKARRMRHRRTLGPSSSRIDGGWQELMDLRTDLGRPLDPLVTRTETAMLLEKEAPEMPAALLASRADRGVFAPGELPQAAVDEYWQQILDGRTALLAAAPWHRRLRARFSLRSFRHRSQLRRRAEIEARRLDRRRTAADARQEASRRRGSPRLETEHSGLRARWNQVRHAVTDRLPRRRARTRKDGSS